MDAHVIFEADCPAEFFATDVTDWLLAWFPPVVNPHVVLERTGVATAFATGFTNVLPLSRVGQHVVLKGTLVTTAFTTNFTGEEFFSSVFAQVAF